MTELILEGSVSVLSALQAGRREITAVYVQEGKEARGLGHIERLAAERGVAVQRAPAAEVDALAQGSTHGGVLALAGPRRYESLNALVAPGAFVAMLDGVEDPYNYGQAIRALYAAGAAGLVAPPRDWDNALAVVARASGGASELMPTAQADALEAIRFFKGRGFRCAATAKDGKSQSIYAVDLHGALFVLIGGEKRGLSAAALAECDVLLNIPYGRRFEASLDVTSSTAAVAFEVMRQRSWPQRRFGENRKDKRT